MGSQALGQSQKRKVVNFLNYLLATACLMLLSGCFWWDVRVLHSGTMTAPYVANQLITEAWVVEGGYFDRLLRELDSRKVDFELEYSTYEHQGEQKQIATIDWTYQGLLIADMNCGSDNVCTVSFSHWIDPDEFPEFELFPPTLSLAVLLPADKYLRSDADEIVDRDGYKMLSWQFNNIKPRTKVKFSYAFER